MFYVCTAQTRGGFLAGTHQGWLLRARHVWASPPRCVPDHTLASGPFPVLGLCTHLPPGTSSQTPGLPFPSLVPQRSWESLSLSLSRDCSPPGLSAHGILQARTLQWVAISYSREVFQTQGSNSCLLLLHWQVGSLLVPPGKPQLTPRGVRK